MAYLTLNGDFITLNGDRLVLNGGAAPIRRGWDDGGELKRFWQARADKWIAENLPVVRKAAKAKVSRTIIIETLTAAALQFRSAPRFRSHPSAWLSTSPALAGIRMGV